MAIGEVVKNRHITAGMDEFHASMGTDIAGTTGYKNH
jgi:hypothetical protein